MEEQFFDCPHCWERVSILVDLSVDGHHQFVEDCEVCCNPLRFDLQVDGHTVVDISAESAQ